MNITGNLYLASTPNLVRLGKSLGLDVSEQTPRLRLIRAVAVALSETETEKRGTGYFT